MIIVKRAPSFLIDSATMNLIDRVASEPERAGLLEAWETVQRFPMTIYVRGGALLPAGYDACNWFVPNVACLTAWVRSSGFEIRDESGVLGWHFIQARKIARPFPVRTGRLQPHVQRKKKASADKVRVRYLIVAATAFVVSWLRRAAFERRADGLAHRTYSASSARREASIHAPGLMCRKSSACPAARDSCLR